MGDYVTDHSDVEVLLPSLTLSGSSVPTDAQVDTMINRREAQLNSVLRAAGYSPPLTSSEDVETCALHVAQIATFDTFASHWELDDYPPSIENYRTDWLAFLDMIRKGEIEFASDSPESANHPAFGIIRQPTRDRIFTERNDTTDWDE
jgi:hypothetical protein